MFCDICKSPPKKVIGKDTIGSIQSGIIFGYAGLVDGMVRRMAREIGNIRDHFIICGHGRIGRILCAAAAIAASRPDRLSRLNL